MKATRKTSAPLGQKEAAAENRPPSEIAGHASPGAAPDEPGRSQFEWGRILLFFMIAIPLVVAVLLKDSCG